ncbi:MAG TPA: hypothetical protein VFB62_05550, partial [Polyangiaceae bacterium]|nr:hypothetical protein [Polyangiaceae bacterium]
MALEYVPIHVSALVLIALVGCGGVDEETHAPAAASTEVCADGELTLPDGRCIRPGIPPDGCAAGFVHDGDDGCEPILPEEPCAPGLIAVPGDPQCRPVMPCGEGRWGDIPLEATTQFVDARYAGGASDGSAERPWTTIGDAVAAAPENGLIAIGAGTYSEDVVVAYKTLRIWGVCPDQVEIVGMGASGCPGSVCFVWSAAAEL